MLIERPTLCIVKIQVSIPTSSLAISTPLTLTFLVHVLSFKMLNKEFRGMFHNLLAFLNVTFMFFISSIASLNASYVHFLLSLIVGIL